MTEKETLKTIREGILSGKCSDGNLAWIVNLCDEVLAELGSANVGNAAAMRSVLKYIVSLLRGDTFVVLNLPAVEIIAKIILASEAALAAPPRQCDVGTANEQMSRYCKFTDRYNPCSYKGYARCAEDCPINLKLRQEGNGELQCQLEWAQMPYTEEKGGAELCSTESEYKEYLRLKEKFDNESPYHLIDM